MMSQNPPLLAITKLQPEDHPVLLDLFRSMPTQHLHLDWRGLSQWLSHPDFHCYIGRKGETIQSVMGVNIQQASSVHSEKIAWLRFALSTHPINGAADLYDLWQTLHTVLNEAKVCQIAILTNQSWIEPFLIRSGFELTNAVIAFVREPAPIPELTPSLFFRIRGASPADLKAIAHVDQLAFKSIWQYTLPTLALAVRQAKSLLVAEQAGQIVAYQLSTQHHSKGHLARLAVHPDVQQRGIAKHLLCEMFYFFSQRNIGTITVNTQEDNMASQHLYRKLGFTAVNNRIPVWTHKFN